MALWNPWRGCRKKSDGCKYCYIHSGQAKRGEVIGEINRADSFYAPLAKLKNGEYKMKSGQLVYLCFSSDFLIEDADEWRAECWDMIRERQDLNFLFLTKRIERFESCAPPDWFGGWDNVTVGCTCENQQTADERLTIFGQLPIKHKNIVLQPLIEEVDISGYLKEIELVVLGGESGAAARPLDFEWVLAVRDACLAAKVPFEFRQCGSKFIKDGVHYKLNRAQLTAQARKANINLK